MHYSLCRSQACNDLPGRSEGVVTASSRRTTGSIGGPSLNPRAPLAYDFFKLLRFLNLNGTQPPIPLFTFSLSSAPPLTPRFKAPLSFGSRGYSNTVSMVIGGVRLWSSEPVSGNVTSSLRPRSPRLLSGKGGDSSYGGGRLGVIICAYEEGRSSLSASSWQLL